MEIREVPTPTPADNEVLVRVRASSVCFGDRIFRSGPLLIRLLSRFRPRHPILGVDLAGTVETVGSRVTRFAPGDAVYGARGDKFAAHAEFACVAEDGFLARKPATMTFEEAGTVFVGAACSLYLLRRANVKPGERVLVHGASGSLGVFAVQLAKHFGAHVTAVCSSANVQLVRSLGADEVIDLLVAHSSYCSRAPMILFQSLLSPAISRLWSKRLWKGNDSAAKRKCFPKKWTSVTALSPAIVQNLTRPSAAAKKAAGSKSTILLLGESGTGKELFARAIHNWSERKDRPFIAINCVGLSKELLESELFGHEKGAFTGASQLKRGKIEIGNGGTVFLDEVGDISEELQAKLLRFLQEREFERVGGTQLIRVDVRIIAATNRNLEAAVKEGRFREDLFYRINVVPIVLPPLRGRKEDVPALAQFFMQRFSDEAKKNFAEISQEALETLMGYDWPGNVRELANVIERAVVLGQPPTIQIEDLSPGIVAPEAEVDNRSTPPVLSREHRRIPP